MTERQPDLPGLYDLVVIEKADSAVAQAQRLARKGADEGTLVWAKAQQEGVGREGNFWMSGNRNLHCALVLRPEDDFASCCQISLLNCICTAMAIARQAEPLEEIRFRWPNDVLLNRGKVAGMTLSGELDARGRPGWMVVGVNVNVHECPSSRGFSAASMRGEGFRDPDRVALLEAYAREFLSWINRWADEGFAPVRKAWLTKSPDEGEVTKVRLGDLVVSGKYHQLDESGSLHIFDESSSIRTVTLEHFFRQDFLAP